MKNSKDQITFSQEMVDHIMQSFEDDAERINRLANPLVSLSLDEN